jgi:zinc protease
MKSPILRIGKLMLLLVLSIQVTAQFDLKTPIPKDPKVRIGKLANGLTYYIHQNPKPEKKVELRLVVNTGSVLEDPDQRGLAHFMEHMNFNGTTNFKKNELVDYLQNIGVKFGADLNAYTGFDETVYILPIPSDDPKKLEQGFLVLEDWAFNNLLDKSEIEKERGVVLEESRLSQGSQERMSRQYFPKLFNGSIYGERLPIGKDSVLQHFKYATLERFYRQWYRPNLMAVVVVGDIDPAVAEQKIKAHFSKYKNPASAKPRPAIIPIKTWTKPEAMVVTDEEATNTVLQMYNFVKPAKQIKTWGDLRQSTVEGLVSSLINQRLQELTQSANAPFMFASTGMNQFLRGYQAFTSFAVLGENTADEAIQALIAETERARQFGFLAAELERAKANLLNGAERQFKERDKSESGQIVWQYVNHYLQQTPIPGAENRFKFLQHVLPTITLDEVNSIAKKMPAPTNAFTLITAPEKMKDKLPTSEALLQSVVAATTKPLTAYEEKAVASALMDAVPTAGSVVNEKKNEKLGTTDFVLSNGITVTIKPTTFKNDQVQMDAWRWGGTHKFGLADKENASQAATIVREMGIRDMAPTDLKKFLAGKSVTVMPYMNDHEEGIEGTTSVKDFETFLQLTHLYFTQPRKDEGLFNAYVKKQKGMLQYLKQDPELFYQDTLMKIVYKNNPWMQMLPTEADMAKLDLEKAYAIYRQVFGNAHGMHFTFVGNLDPATAKPLLEKYLGSLPATTMEPMYKDHLVRPVSGVVEANIKKGKEKQSFITLMFTGETTYTREDAMALRALLDALNIKVVEKLREEMSGIYGGGFSGSIERRPYTHYTITASVPCGPENVEKLTAALMDLIKTAQEKGVDPKDLQKVKETWKKQYQTGIQTNDFWLSQLSNAWINRENPEAVLDYEQRVDALTGEAVQKAAQKFLNMNNYVKAVLYPENAVIPEGKKAF